MVIVGYACVYVRVYCVRACGRRCRSLLCTVRLVLYLFVIHSSMSVPGIALGCLSVELVRRARIPDAPASL